ncbi:hypothetical protein HMPREF3156_01693 [Neisseria sp. HMSC06F02]|nr:hypothetical protein HMPREF3156_01693 [Neisseria sp. HMSC06F02]
MQVWLFLKGRQRFSKAAQIAVISVQAGRTGQIFPMSITIPNSPKRSSEKPEIRFSDDLLLHLTSA